MKLLGRIAAILVGLVLLLVALIFGWLYLYTADLPSVAILDQYAPSTPAEVRTETGSAAHIVPSDQLGKWLHGAVLAAEGQPDPRGPIHAALASFVWATKPQGQMYSWQIARELGPRGDRLGQQIDRLRMAQQIHRRFNQQQILTIFLSRVRFGPDVNGVDDASVRYFGKHVSDLSLDEAALIAGLIRAPSHDSPINHPERAVRRRNWVLENMVRQGSVSQASADQAEEAPLIVKRTADSDATYDWKRCALTIASHGSPISGPIRPRPGEELKTTPVISFEVMESGEIRNPIVSRSSGVADIDNDVLSNIRNLKYLQRPPGCGIIQSQYVANIDF